MGGSIWGDIITGAAVLKKRNIDIIRLLPIIVDKLKYERKPIPGNKYHGNLILKKDVNKGEMKLIAATIATCVTEVVTK